MNKYVITVILCVTTFLGFSQDNSYYKVGDTLFYENNRATYVRTNTIVVVKETNVTENNTIYKVEKFLLDESKNKYVLDSKFTTNSLQLLKANGAFISYHKNGKKASEGKTLNGKKGDGLWLYYHENGEKKSEEKMSTGTYFSEKIQNRILNFWNDKGQQTVTDGTGFAQFIDKDGLSLKGGYKNGFKNGRWTAFSGRFKKFEESYKKGKLSAGTSWNDTDKSFNYKKVSTPAYYKKTGNSSVRKYIAKKFNTNTIGITGDIFVTFIVTKEGVIEDISIVRGLAADYNEEIKTLLSEMKGWTPAKKRGQAYDSKYLLDLRFSE